LFAEPTVSRLYRAGGLFRAPVGAHVISVGLGARMFQSVLPGTGETILSPLSDGSPLSLAGPAPPGWAVHLHGAAEGTPDPALGLDFGFDYLRPLSTRESSHLVPQAGATWRPSPGTSLKGGVSWLAESYAGAADARPALPRNGRARDPLGYSLAFEQRAGQDT